jgi:copper chaperone NosL
VKALLLAVAFALVAIGCSAAAATGPPQVKYGRDICIECGMVIEDERFAAGYRLDDGTEKTFDDLGGLIIHGREAGELMAATVWVHDFETREWTEAAQAFYVPTLGIDSPMGHGILAFSERDRAERFASDLGGEVIEWEVVVELPVMDGLVGDHHMDDSNHDGNHDG